MGRIVVDVETEIKMETTNYDTHVLLALAREMETDIIKIDEVFLRFYHPLRIEVKVGFTLSWLTIRYSYTIYPFDHQYVSNVLRKVRSIINTLSFYGYRVTGVNVEVTYRKDLT